MSLNGKNGKTYTLGSEIKAGGEGTVYTVQGDSKVVAKLYHPSTPASKLTLLEKKLKVMVDDTSFDPYDDGRLRFAWPLDILYDKGKFVGFIMPNAKGTYEFHEIMWTDKQTQFRRYDYNRSIAVACNLALTVNYVHSKGYVIGDMNIKNFRFDRECHVIVLDVDSFDVTDKQTGAHYKCCVGCPDVLAPELQGLRLDTERAKFTKQTDYFSLAILIFMFLMNGAHPFNAPKITTASGYSSSASDNGIMVDIANGNCPYVRLNTGRQVPKYAPDYVMIPAVVREMFRRTFNYTQSTATQAISKRATAEEFAKVLYMFLQREKTTCSTDSRHLYITRLSYCPFCAADRRMRNITGTTNGSTYKHISVKKVATATPAKAPTPATTTTPPAKATTSQSANSSKKTGFLSKVKSFFS